MTTTARALAPTTVDALFKLADEELFAGHVLTSLAGWGPELEVNLALSSIGQDELGHARLYYSLAVGADRRTVNVAIFERTAPEFRACALAEQYDGRWAHTVVKGYLYDTGDGQRLAVLASSQLPGLSDAVERMESEERFHRAHWTTWLERTAGAGDDARGRVEAAWRALRPAAPALFDFDADALGVSRADLAAARDAYLAEVDTTARELGLVAPADGNAPLAGARDRILDELQYVYREAPGQW